MPSVAASRPTFTQGLCRRVTVQTPSLNGMPKPRNARAAAYGGRLGAIFGRAPGRRTRSLSQRPINSGRTALCALP
jgi:hypothetical protein